MRLPATPTPSDFQSITALDYISKMKCKQKTPAFRAKDGLGSKLPSKVQGRLRPAANASSFWSGRFGPTLGSLIWPLTPRPNQLLPPLPDRPFITRQVRSESGRDFDLPLRSLADFSDQERARTIGTGSVPHVRHLCRRGHLAAEPGAPMPSRRTVQAHAVVVSPRSRWADSSSSGFALRRRGKSSWPSPRRPSSSAKIRSAFLRPLSFPAGSAVRSGFLISAAGLPTGGKLFPSRRRGWAEGFRPPGGGGWT